MASGNTLPSVGPTPATTPEQERENSENEQLFYLDDWRTTTGENFPARVMDTNVNTLERLLEQIQSGRATYERRIVQLNEMDQTVRRILGNAADTGLAQRPESGPNVR